MNANQLKADHMGKMWARGLCVGFSRYEAFGERLYAFTAHGIYTFIGPRGNDFDAPGREWLQCAAIPDDVGYIGNYPIPAIRKSMSDGTRQRCIELQNQSAYWYEMARHAVDAGYDCETADSIIDMQRYAMQKAAKYRSILTD